MLRLFTIATCCACGSYERMQGSVEYERTIDGDVVCQAKVSFTGVPFTGECSGCDFLFEIESTLTDDRGTQACEYFPTLSLYETSAAYGPPLLLGFYSDYDGYIGEGVPGPADVLMVGYQQAFTWGGDDAEFSLGPAIINDRRGATVTFGDGALTWFNYVDDDVYGDPIVDEHYPYFLRYNFCTLDYVSTATGPYVEGQTTTGQLPCAGGYADSFTFQGIDGGEARITVDAVKDGGDISPVLVVYSPDSCLQSLARDDFACSYGNGRCAAARIDTVDGEYLLAVLSPSACSGGTSAAYRIDVDAPWDAVMTARANDVRNEGARTIAVDGSASLSR